MTMKRDRSKPRRSRPVRARRLKPGEIEDVTDWSADANVEAIEAGPGEQTQ